MGKSQELAFMLLKEAREEGRLDPSIESRLIELIGAEKRSRIKGVLEAPVATEPKKLRELSFEQQTKFLSMLQARFAKNPEHYKRPKNVRFADVKRSLMANPMLMYGLARMEDTGGFPDIIAIEEDAFIFADCSPESPDRRDLTYDQVAQMAKDFGVNMVSEHTYSKMQGLGEFDWNTHSWLSVPADVRESGEALEAFRRSDGIILMEQFVVHHSPDKGWRGVLRVPKI